MKLFYASGASSLAVHILLREAQADCRLEKVDLVNSRWSGGDFSQINAKGYVPVLELDQGSRLTECAVILQYLADIFPTKQLMPDLGTFERYRAMEWLNYIATEIHKNFIAPERRGKFSSNFLPNTLSGQSAARAAVAPRLEYMDRVLDGKDYLMGPRFTAPDAYLFTMLTWANRLELDISRWEKLVRYFHEIASRSAVIDTLKAEGPAHSLKA